MTDLLQRAAGGWGWSSQDHAPRPLALSALVVSVVTAAGGLIVATGLAMAAWLGGGSGSATDAFRAGVIGWLAGQGSGVNVSQTSVTAVPLGVLALVVMAVYTLARRLGAGSSI